MKRILAKPYWTILFICILVLGFIQHINAQQKQVNQQNSWIGQYRFFDGQNNPRANSPSDFIDYKITVFVKDEKFTADFFADSTQLPQRFSCTVKINGSQMSLYFEKDLTGNESEMTDSLKKGDLVGTLIRKKTNYLFTPGKYKIYPLSQREGTPIYFKKIN
jgi:hypothetical protein